MKTIKAADLFCGAGGASTGFVRACQEFGIDYELLAVNHWPIAVETHSTNHPGVRHLCESVEKIDPREAVPGGRLHLLLAGPECTHFSTARGGRPVNPQSRASAWHILKWAQELYIDTILIENVPEFRTWGPIGANHKPLKSRKGETYKAFLAALQSLGYRVEDRILNAADYGDPTTRKRLFIMARRGRHQIAWPAPTHSKTGSPTLFGHTQKWRAAREVIDWNIPGKSIFTRKKPLRPATIARILAGLEKFGGPELRPFLVVLRKNQAGQSIDGPVPTLTTSGAHVGLAQPVLLHLTHGGRAHSVDAPVPTLTTARRGELAVAEAFVLGQQSGGYPRSVEQPLPTIATDGAISVIEPFLVPYYGEKGGESKPRVHGVDEPLKTQTTENRFGLAQPFLVPMYGERNGQEPRTHSVDEPVPTIPATGGGKFGVVEPCIVQTNERRAERVQSVDDPLRTITALGGRCFGLAQPFLTKYNRTATGAYSVDEPIDTISTRDRFGVVEPFILQQQSNGAPRSTDEPLPTIATAGKQALVEPFIFANRTHNAPKSIDEPIPPLCTGDHIALVQPVIDGYVLDIHFRMLQPHELAAATSFPKTYVFRGTREDVVKQIGNSWPGELSYQLNRAALQDYAPAKKRRTWREEATA